MRFPNISVNYDIEYDDFKLLALSLLHGGTEDYCKKALSVALGISKEKTALFVEQLYCQSEFKNKLKELIK